MSDRGFLLDVSDAAVEDKDSVSSGLASLSVRNSDSEGEERNQWCFKRLCAVF